jgi:hypothetical protein
LILQFLQNLYATASAVQRIPNAQQDPLSVSPPLMVPKPQLLNPIGIQKSFSRDVEPPLIRKSVREAVEFDAKASLRTVEIEGKRAKRMLTAELKPGESAGTQRLPQLLFLFGLFSAETPNIASRIHGCDGMRTRRESKKLIDKCWECASSPLPSPPQEEREKRRASWVAKRVRLSVKVVNSIIGP